MKKTTIIMLFLLTATGSVFSQKTKSVKKAPPATGLVLKNGDVLSYEVSKDGQSWHFEVTVKEIREAIVFDWIMPEKNISGQVTLEPQSRKSAVIYQNYFADSTESDFFDTSTVWLSKKNFTELKKGSSILTLDHLGAERFDRKEAKTIGIIKGEKAMNLKTFRITNGKTGGDLRELWILDQAAQPLIIQMNLGWTITLKEIKSFKSDY